jgi:MFS family permease
MLPLSLFNVRNFSVGNIATGAIYGALAIATFLVTVFVQQVGGYSAIQAGMALLPVTIILFLLSPRMGALAGTYGPRAFMAIGPIISGVGFLYMLGVDSSVHYWSQLFPGVILFGLGLSITVAPLTTAILSSIKKEQAGIGSATNNAIARVAGLVAIATLGVIAGPSLDLDGFHRGIAVTGLLFILGGLVSAIGIQNPQRVKTGHAKQVSGI